MDDLGIGAAVRTCLLKAEKGVGARQEVRGRARRPHLGHRGAGAGAEQLSLVVTSRQGSQAQAVEGSG